MDSERWRRVEELYHAALAHPADLRPAFLQAACQGDDSLWREIRSLLDQGDGTWPQRATIAHPDLPTPALIGRRIGSYEVQGLLGAGGMGEVYRARDSRLGREVAIKILPREWVTDSDRVVRLEREARALASLNHPNIATIHGIEETDGSRALILELIEGPTLADRIARGPLPVAEALAIARQIVDGLEAAHEKGMVHRDLKPANIKITPAGIVKVLDFGLVKLDRGLDGERGDSPTLTADGTRAGVIVGTAAYMSPEQARGLPVDKRTDIWAFGCVLYEMLAGRAVFASATITDTLAAILDREPDWSAVPAATPPGARRLLRRCLVKDPKRRLRDLGDARLELEEPLTADTSGIVAKSAGSVRVRPRALIATAVGLVGLAAMGMLVSMLSRRSVDTRSPAVTRTTVNLPSGVELDRRSAAGPLAIAPDGRRLAYVAHSEGRVQLYLRSLDAFEAKPLAGTDGAEYPFFSPDGEWIAFFADRKLRRVSVQGGTPIVITDVPVTGHGGTWARDGTIVFDPGQVGLMRVPAAGGRPERLTSNDPSIDQQNLSWPHFLPDGRRLLATIGPPGAASALIGQLSLDTGEWHQLGPGSQAQYVTSGLVVYHALDIREGEVHAVRFNPETLARDDASATVLDSVFRAQNGGAAYFAVSQSGTLIFTPGGYARTLVRVDRSGRRTRVTDDHRGFRHPEISPDGLKVAVTIDPRPSQIWVYDLARRSGVPLSTEGHSLSPVWTPDSRRVTYTSQGDIFWRVADASTAAERLLARERPQYATSWSTDGKLLLFNDSESERTAMSDVWLLPLAESPRPLLASRDNEQDATFSPDNRWVAYASDESGAFEVYVRPFPNVEARKWRISTAGGRHPVWSRTGRELFYAAGSALMRVTVSDQNASVPFAIPELLFSGPFDLATTDYAVVPDGSHFIMVESDLNERLTQLHVVGNWTEEARRLLGPKRGEH